MSSFKLKNFLDNKVVEYSVPAFVESDPVSIPHQFSRLQDIEISGFFAALFAWGRRSTVLKKSRFLLELMDDAPYDFIMQHEESDLKRFLGFVHRTFNATDILYLISFLKRFYAQNNSLELAFSEGIKTSDSSIENGLNHFYATVFEDENHPVRTHKHISTPLKKSACKRINMYLRWMVRPDKDGIDFGLWKRIRTDQLIIPMDVHVSRVAARLKLLSEHSKVNWESAVKLTRSLKDFDALDPVKYDYALFGLGAIEKFS